MALAASNLTSTWDNVDRTSYSTASISPAANSLLIVYVFVSAASVAGSGVVAGLGLTWNLVNSRLDGGRSQAVHWAQCGASPGSGALTLTWTGGDATSTGLGWFVIQVTGHNTAAPIVQFKLAGGDGSSSAAPSGTLTNAIGAAGNRVMSFVSHRISEVTNPRASWTELGDHNGTVPATGIECQWRNDGTNETTFSATYATSARYIFHAIEIAIASAATGGRPKVWTGSAWAQKPGKIWTGSAWVEKPVKRWNGSAWITLT